MRGGRVWWRFAPLRGDKVVAKGWRGLLCAMLLVGTACAGGPRWVTGAPYFSSNGSAVSWNTKSLQYWTDEGDLSGTVNHAAADAMVATAAGVWNVSVSSMVVSQGGVLAEDVSGANVYMGSTGPVFPGDVRVGNAGTIPVAVIYDADGAVTDMLLGGGASDPGNCRQTAVTESVDGISAAGKITHALLILNGRCTGSAPALQMEMTYRLVRAFGRILGVGWSQLNDNMFTGVPMATYAQAMHWPVMHPIDVLCGPYAYQCMPQPFVLRPDDVATMVLLYPATASDVGKTPSFTKATPFVGVLSFPNGQGMRGVNVVTRRWNQSTVLTDTFEETSAVTGYRFQQVGASPVAAKGTGVAASQGWVNGSVEGQYSMPWIPIDDTTYWQSVIFTTQAVNPLYTGQYAVGPYGFGSQVLPSGPAVTFRKDGVGPYGSAQTVNLPTPATVATCAAAADGTAAAPVSVDTSGMWQGVMCGYGHTAWASVVVKAGRTLTVEVTAVDEQGLATSGKMQPVFGIWASTDAATGPPTVASAATAMNTATLGMTAATVTNGSARTLRMGFGDQRGDGRPDYGYKARVLYADGVAPATLPANGGSITISGMGFRNGNAVLVNGVAAQVLSWTANTIMAVAPAMVGVVTADVTVMDVSTGGTTTVTGAVSYGGTTLPDVVSVVTVPADGSALGVAADGLFGVKVLLPDGISPAVGVGVSVSATHGAVLVGCGGASACMLITDGAGMVRTGVVPSVSGAVSLGAVVGTVTVAASFVAGGRAADVLRVTSLPVGTVYAGVPAALPWSVQVLLGDGVTPDAGAQVTITAQGAGLGGCGGAASCVLTADGMGLVATTVVPAAAGVVSLAARAGAGAVSASFGVVAMPPDGLRVVSVPANGTLVGSAAAAGFGVEVLIGDGVTVAAGAAVSVQAVGAGLGACGGASTCVLTADGAGRVLTGVTPSVVGSVMLSAMAGGGLAQATFTAMAVPPNRLQPVSTPANGSVTGVASGVPFGVRLVQADGVTPVVGAAVTLTVTGGVFGVCGAAVCVVATDAAGLVASSVTPAAAGTVRMTAAVQGLSVSSSFTAVADTLRVVWLPAGQAYEGVPTRSPVVLQVLGTDGVTPAAGTSVTVRLMSLGTLAACGGPVCVMTADAQGMVSTLVTPAVRGAASIEATAGGGTLETSFGVAAMPPDIVRVVAVPVGPVYTGLTAPTPVTFQVFLGDGVNVHAQAWLAVYPVNAALPSAGCGASCNRTADANGMFSSTVLPQHDGTVTVTVWQGYSKATATFVALPLPPDILTVLSAPADGAVPGRVASPVFSVQAMLGDGRTVAVSVPVTLTATGATLGCGQTTCVAGSNSRGQVATAVKPTGAGRVVLTATAGGGSVTASFVAVTPPDLVQVMSVPADGTLAGQAAARAFQVKVLLADGVIPAAGVSVTLTANGGTLGACGLATCVVTAGATGLASSPVTPRVGGVVGLTASAGGGSASASFVAALPADAVAVVSVPGDGAYVGRVAGVPFSVKVTRWDGSVAGGASVTLTAVGGTLGACGSGVCVMTTDGGGMVSTTVTPTVVGAVGLTAAAGGGSVTAAFTARAVPPDVLTVMSVPGGGAYVGRTAAMAFSVKVTHWDGTVASGAAVTLTAVGGTLGTCGSSSCVIAADRGGVISTTVSPAVAGIVGLTAAAGGGAVSASFLAVVVPPAAVTVVSVPASGGYVGSVAPGVFRVNVAPGDGTVGAGVAVTLTASGGTLGVCGAAQCVVSADNAGIVATTVTATAAGLVGLRAEAGGGSVTASFAAVDHVRAMSMVQAVEYVAAGARVNWTPRVVVTLDGVTVAETVRWTGGAGMVVGDSTGSSDAVVIGPLAAGAAAEGKACAWGTVCASFGAVVVDEGEWGLAMVSGGGQAVSLGGGFDPVMARVVDGTGHGVAGARVNVDQVVRGAVICPGTGRCPVGPWLGASSAVVVSDGDGLVAVTPLVVGGKGERTGIVLTAGTGGFLSTSVAVAF